MSSKRKPIFVVTLPIDTSEFDTSAIAKKLENQIGLDYYVLVVSFGDEIKTNLYGEVKSDEFKQIEENIIQWIKENQNSEQ